MMAKKRHMAEQIRAQMESGSCSFDCWWYGLRAFRHGFDDKAVRGALIRFLKRFVEDREEPVPRVALLLHCCRHGILAPEHAQQIRELQGLARMVDDPKEERRNDWVAERIAAKRAQFFRFKRLTSLTSTCRRHGINPQAYLTQLLANLPDTPVSDLDQWLPDEWKKRSAGQPIESNPCPT